MALPGSVVPPGDDWVTRELRDLRQMIDRQSAARSAEATAIGAGGIRSVDFDGTGPDDPGTQGWMIGRLAGQESYLVMNGKLVVTGITSIAGLLAIVGALTVSGTTAITGPLSIEGATAITGPLDVTGATTLGGATTITGDTTVTGDLDVSGALDVGGTATITGNLQSSNYVAGTSGYRLTPTTIEMNDLAIKAEAVPDAALASLVKGAAGSDSQTASLTTSAATYATVTLTVPSGVTTVAVTATSSAWITQTGLNAYLTTQINGVDGEVLLVAVDSADHTGNAATSHARIFSVTPGASITISTRAQSIGSSGTIQAVTSASAIFYR